MYQYKCYYENLKTIQYTEKCVLIIFILYFFVYLMVKKNIYQKTKK